MSYSFEKPACRFALQDGGLAPKEDLIQQLPQRPGEETSGGGEGSD